MQPVNDLDRPPAILLHNGKREIIRVFSIVEKFELLEPVQNRFISLWFGR